MPPTASDANANIMRKSYDPMERMSHLTKESTQKKSTSYAAVPPSVPSLTSCEKFKNLSSA
jgi:hypothetical protein